MQLASEFMWHLARKLHDLDNDPKLWAGAATMEGMTALLRAQTVVAAMREIPTPLAQKVWAPFAPYWSNHTSPPTLTHRLGSNPGSHWEAMIDEILRVEAPDGSH